MRGRSAGPQNAACAEHIQLGPRLHRPLRPGSRPRAGAAHGGPDWAGPRLHAAGPRRPACPGVSRHVSGAAQWLGRLSMPPAVPCVSRPCTNQQGRHGDPSMLKHTAPACPIGLLPCLPLTRLGAYVEALVPAGAALRDQLQGCCCGYAVQPGMRPAVLHCLPCRRRVPGCSAGAAWRMPAAGSLR